MKLVTVDEMLDIEQQADASGLTYERMMENAGKGLAEVIADHYGHLPKPSACGLIGSGNNGGDTLVALAALAKQGWSVAGYLVNARPDDDPYVERLRQAGGEIILAPEDKRNSGLRRMLRTHQVLLDGILGTGMRLPLRGKIPKILKAVRRTIERMDTPPAIVAVDCPSGVDCQSGESAEQVLPAELTVTMAAVKVGLLCFPAFGLVGDLRLVDIGLSEDLKPWKEIVRRVADKAMIRDVMPHRPLDAHKGTFGTVLVIGGSMNYTGAPLLTGEAAYRVGAGLVSLAVPTPVHTSTAGSLPEATWLLLPHEIGVISVNAVNVVRQNLERVKAIALGPGLGQEATTRDFLAQLIDRSAQPTKGPIGFVQTDEEPGEGWRPDFPPMVIDADGLKLLADIQKWQARIPIPSVLTPHPGEMAVLTGHEVREIQSDRIGIAERYAQEWGHVVVLKGACTVVANPEGASTVIPIATPALAKAGTGDVLTGLIAGLLAQGVAAYPAAIAGAWLHARAGVRAGDRIGNTASVLAGDVLDSVIEALGEL